MINQLFFTAALLVSGLAYAGTPSATLPGQIVPASGITCDYGPNAASVPTAAQRAGFTHCALNADFTIVGGQWSNPSTYVYPCGAPASNWPTTANFNLFYFLVPNASPPCSRLEIIADPVFGGQVLHFQYKPGDFNTAPPGHGNWIELDWPLGFDQSQQTILPLEMYVKLVFRTTTTSLNQGNNALESFGPWNSPNTWSFPNAAPMEMDFDEIVDGSPNGFPLGPPWQNAFAGQPSFGQNCVFLKPGGTCNDSSGFKVDWTQYHTLEALITSDATNTAVNCVILDGVYQICNQISGHGSAVLNYPANTLSFNIGVACTTSPCAVNNVDAYIQSIQYWACANYKTANCPGPIISGP
jgi:hypothetical protein